MSTNGNNTNGGVRRSSRSLFQQHMGDPSLPENGTTERVDPTMYLNIGYMEDYTDDEGKTAQRFISIPLGVGLDTQRKFQVTTSNSPIMQLRQKQNNLLDDLVKFATDTLKPGENQVLDLYVQVQRVAEKVERIEVDTPRFKVQALATEKETITA